ncbi:MAG: TSUP family transporter [Oscillospiraceae bacterium]|jgi:uncharacterized membrane protein YfcA|nr:TSUP family transporter [Oscillospiraceae bacterium]
MLKFFKTHPKTGAALSGGSAGLANGLFGAGGGMLLLPLLQRTTKLEPHETFACSVCIILPLTIVSAVIYYVQGGMDFSKALPYLIGGAIGGVIAGLTLKRISAVWLHRILGAVILWGGLRLLLS